MASGFQSCSLIMIPISELINNIIPVIDFGMFCDVAQRALCLGPFTKARSQ